MEHIGIIEEAGQRATKKGGTAFHMQLKDPKWGYYLFDAAHKEIAEKNIGKKIKVTYTENEKGRNVSAIEVVAEQMLKPRDVFATSLKERTEYDTMSGADWERKDRMIHRCGIARSVLEGLGRWDEVAANAAFAWVIEAPAAKPAKAVAAPTAQQGGNEDLFPEEKPARTRGALEDEIRNIMKAKGYNPQECKDLLYSSELFGVISLGQLTDRQLPKALEWAKALKAKGG